jgi:hypothetical protein
LLRLKHLTLNIIIMSSTMNPDLNKNKLLFQYCLCVVCWRRFQSVLQRVVIVGRSSGPGRQQHLEVRTGGAPELVPGCAFFAAQFYSGLCITLIHLTVSSHNNIWDIIIINDILTFILFSSTASFSRLPFLVQFVAL